MNYIDRTKIGIEMFLGQLSPLTSALNQHTPEETVELVETWTLVENVALPENEAEMKAFEDKFCG